MKKILFILVILSIVLSVFCTGGVVAYADDGLGNDLDGYDAEIVYRFYILPATGIRVEYALLYDTQYYIANQETLSGAIKSLANLFTLNEWEVSSNVSTGSFSAYLAFDTTTDFYVYSGYDGFEKDDVSDAEETKTFFYTDTVSQSETAFAYLFDEQKLVGRIYKTGCQKAGIAIDKVLLKYTYGTPYSSEMLTSNAREVSFSSEYGIYLHNFYIPSSEPDTKITLKTHTPNSTGWYIVAVGAALFVAAIPLSICFIKRKRSKK